MGTEELPREYEIKPVTSAIPAAVSDLCISLPEKVKKEQKRMKDMRGIWQIKVLKDSYAMKAPKLSRKLAYVCGEIKQASYISLFIRNQTLLKLHTLEVLLAFLLPSFSMEESEH